MTDHFHYNGWTVHGIRTPGLDLNPYQPTALCFRPPTFRKWHGQPVAFSYASIDRLPKEILEMIASRNTFLDERRFAVYNFVSKRWNNACYASVIPNLRLYIGKLMKGGHIQGFLRRIALPAAGQIRHIRIDGDDWNRLEVHLTAAAAFYHLPDLSQIKDFASAFSRLKSILLDTSILHYIDETLQDGVNGRHLRDVPLSNFWRAQLPDFETAGMADFIQNQRLAAGCTPPCCRSCAVRDSNYEKQPPKTGLRFLKMHRAQAANALGTSKERTQRHFDRSEDHQMKLDCPLAIDCLSSKWLKLDCKDAEVYIHVMGPENAMRIQGIQKGTKYMKRREFKIFQCPLPRPSSSYVELKQEVEGIICGYLLDVGMIDAIPDDVIEEKTPQLPANDWMKWWE